MTESVPAAAVPPAAIRVSVPETDAATGTSDFLEAERTRFRERHGEIALRADDAHLETGRVTDADVARNRRGCGPERGDRRPERRVARRKRRVRDDRSVDLRYRRPRHTGGGRCREDYVRELAEQNELSRGTVPRERLVERLPGT